MNYITKNISILFLFIFSLFSTLSFAVDVPDLTLAIEKNKIEDVKTILNAGIDPNQITYFSVMPSIELSNLLLENKNNPMDPGTFLGLIINVSVETYNSQDNTYTIDNKLIAQSDGLIKLALEKGADPSKIDYFSRLPSIELSNLLLENKNKPMDQSLFLSLILNTPTGIRVCDTNQINQKFELVKLALAKGADPNKNEILEIIIFDDLNLEILELLFNNSYKTISSNAVNNFVSFAESQIVDMTISRSIKYRHLNTISSYVPKVPRILYHIWLTNEKRKKEIPEKDLQNILSTHRIFLQTGKNWEHIVWTNNRDFIPNSVKILEANGIKVKEITEIKKQFKLGTKIDELIQQESWGMASDSLRYELLKLFGGVYADVNYIFVRDVEGEIHKYDFFAQPGGPGGDLENFFFGAKPNHPIFNEVIDLVYDNFHNPKSYLKTRTGRWVTDITTYDPIIDAYYKAANNGTIDVVYPYIDLDSKKMSAERETIYTDNETFDEDVIKQKIMVIKKYIYDAQTLDALEKIIRLIEEPSNEICGTDKQFFGQDAHGAATWLNP